VRFAIKGSGNPESGFLESFMGNTDMAKVPVARGVNDTKCKLIVAIVFHLFDNGTADYLLCAHPLGSDSDVFHMLGELLPCQFMYGRYLIVDSADEFQFHGMAMINGGRIRGICF
jgi:hypothetical protein